jgi:putative RecB family exonuclease
MTLLVLRNSTAFVVRSRRVRVAVNFTGHQSALTVVSPIRSTAEEELLHPDQFGPIPLPKNLSPSAVLEFKACPQSYLLQYLYKLRQPTSLATAKGSLCHEALEQLFDLDPPDRTLQTLQNLLRAKWAQQRLTDKYRFLFETADSNGWDTDAEREWGQSALQLLQNYYQVEDPRQVQRPNPLRREIWLHANLTLDPRFGSTSREKPEVIPPEPETFYVRGIVDRLDMIKQGKGVALKIVDYKTGKAPTLKYSQPVNERIVEEAFYQLKIYALLLKEKTDDGPSLNPMALRYLELLYLSSEEGTGKTLRYDLGETQEQRDETLYGIHQDLSQVWQNISDLVALQDPKAFVGCERGFCYCHQCRHRFVPGTLWEPDFLN